MSDNHIMDEFKNFLNQYRVFNPKDGKKATVHFTHTTKRCPDFDEGKYDIPPSELSNFFTHYSNVVIIGKHPISVTERSGPYGPLRVDFDMESPAEAVNFKRQYDEDILRSIVKFYQDAIREIVHPKHFNNAMLQCIVLEKRAPRIEGEILKDGFHLHFPNFICDSTIQDQYLRKIINKKMLENKIWKHSKFNDPIDELIDNLEGKTWMLYGSQNHKNKHSTPYLYNRRQDVEDDKDPWRRTTTEGEWGHVYDHELREITMMDVFREDMQGREKRIRYYLPRFLSIRGYTESTKLIDDIEQKIAQAGVTRRKLKVRKIARSRPLEDILEDLQHIKDAGFIDMLSVDRADDYDHWMEVGWTLFCIGEGYEDALNMWIDFSQKSENYKPGECEELWRTMENKGRGMGSLIYMAKNDSPQMFKEYMDTNVDSFIIKSTYEAKPREYDVAMVAVALFGSKYVIADQKKNIWYHFHTHRWHLMPDASALKNDIVEGVQDAYKEYNRVLAEKIKREGGDTTKYEVQQKKILAVISSLKTISFVKNVLEFCKMKMHDPLFMKKRDENRDLFCCENGVLDLKLNIFREGRPDDYCTFSTGIHYTEYHEDDDDVEEFDTFVQKVFPNPNIRNYFMDLVTACMQGGNVNKRFAICTGLANGGKSAVFKLLGKMYGDYMGKFPKELLFRSNRVSSGQAKPELAQVRGRRIMSAQEATHMDSLDVGTLKELTGNDGMFVRNLYEEGSEINPQFTLFLQCNETPNIPGNDEATWARIRIIDFQALFVFKNMLEAREVPRTFAEQMEKKMFHADPHLYNKFDDWAPIMLWRCFRRFPHYKEHGLYEPPEVTASTDSYKSRSDLYKTFRDKYIVKVPLDEAPQTKQLKINTAYTEFNAWYKENYFSYWKKEPIDKHKFKKEMSKRLGFIKNKDKDLYGLGEKESWQGYVLKQPDEDEDSNGVDDGLEESKAEVKPKKFLSPNQG